MQKGITRGDSSSSKTYEALESLVRAKMQEYIQDILEEEVSAGSVMRRTGILFLSILIILGLLLSSVNAEVITEEWANTYANSSILSPN